MDVRLHADRSLPVLLDGGSLPWHASPAPGVERRLLERMGGEVALATSIVRYAPGARFSPHTHDAGEEFLVLSGTFSDEAGDYAEGTYVRNPPGSSHASFSLNGCVIFVKLRQMLADEPEFVRVRPAERPWQADARAGIDRALLYENSRSRVSLLRMAPGASLPARRVSGGEEFFILQGYIEIAAHAGVLGNWGWYRRAATRQPGIRSPHGALLWVKQGHL